jgi:hypothetical protein
LGPNNQVHARELRFQHKQPLSLLSPNWSLISSLNSLLHMFTPAAASVIAFLFKLPSSACYSLYFLLYGGVKLAELFPSDVCLTSLFDLGYKSLGIAKAQCSVIL